jgi:hypothetical protein
MARLSSSPPTPRIGIHPQFGLRGASADPRAAALLAGPGALAGVTPGPGELRVVGLAEDADGERGCSGEG